MARRNQLPHLARSPLRGRLISEPAGNVGVTDSAAAAFGHHLDISSPAADLRVGDAGSVEPIADLGAANELRVSNPIRGADVVVLAPSQDRGQFPPADPADGCLAGSLHARTTAGRRRASDGCLGRAGSRLSQQASRLGSSLREPPAVRPGSAGLRRQHADAHQCRSARPLRRARGRRRRRRTARPQWACSPLHYRRSRARSAARLAGCRYGTRQSGRLPRDGRPPPQRAVRPLRADHYFHRNSTDDESK